MARGVEEVDFNLGPSAGRLVAKNFQSLRRFGNVHRGQFQTVAGPSRVASAVSGGREIWATSCLFVFGAPSYECSLLRRRFSVIGLLSL